MTERALVLLQKAVPAFVCWQVPAAALGGKVACNSSSAISQPLQALSECISSTWSHMTAADPSRQVAQAMEHERRSLQQDASSLVAAAWSEEGDSPLGRIKFRHRDRLLKINRAPRLDDA